MEPDGSAWNLMGPHGIHPQTGKQRDFPKSDTAECTNTRPPQCWKGLRRCEIFRVEIGFGWFWALPTMWYQSDGGPQRYVPESLQSLLGAPTRVIIKQVALSIIQDEVVPRKSAG